MKCILLLVLFLSITTFAQKSSDTKYIISGDNQSDHMDKMHKKDTCSCDVKYWSLSTNMLYDALLVPNIAVEIDLKRGWSLKGSWAYAWFWSNQKHNYWRMYGGGLELRKWFGESSKVKPLQGHHIGIYLEGGTYDVEFGGTGNLSYFSYMAGVSYGYSIPIKRRLNLDLAIGIGYFGGEYKEYYPDAGCYVWRADKQRHYFGPTKAEVSLVWLLGKNNVNAKKGAGK